MKIYLGIFSSNKHPHNDCMQMGVGKIGNWALTDNSCVQLPLHPKMF